MRFLVDACAGRQLAEWLRARGHDVAETRKYGPDPGDEDILAWAAAEGRVLITMDKDFGELIFAEGRAHAGLVRLPHARAAEQVRLMQTLLADHQQRLARGAIATVQRRRIRISLPDDL